MSGSILPIWRSHILPVLAADTPISGFNNMAADIASLQCTAKPFSTKDFARDTWQALGASAECYVSDQVRTMLNPIPDDLRFKTAIVIKKQNEQDQTMTQTMARDVYRLTAKDLAHAPHTTRVDRHRRGFMIMTYGYTLKAILRIVHRKYPDYHIFVNAERRNSTIAAKRRATIAKNIAKRMHQRNEGLASLGIDCSGCAICCAFVNKARISLPAALRYHQQIKAIDLVNDSPDLAQQMLATLATALPSTCRVLGCPRRPVRRCKNGMCTYCCRQRTATTVSYIWCREH